LITDIADALVAVLNAHEFTVDFTAVRKSLPEYDIASDTGLMVSVIPRSFSTELFTRDCYQDEIVVDIGVQKKVAPGVSLNSEVAAVGTLCDEIMDFVRTAALSTTWATIQKITIQTPYAADHLEEYRVFTHVISCHYKAVEEL
jgi:hypothetical protein